jgi:hypothetical protein
MDDKNNIIADIDIRAYAAVHTQQFARSINKPSISYVRGSLNSVHVLARSAPPTYKNVGGVDRPTIA